MSSKFTCRFCKEQFDVPKGLYKHLQSAHNAGSTRDNRTCPICGVLCLKYEGYRDHLLYIHGQTGEGQKLSFKSLNDFLVWKTELELKHNCKYVLQSTPRVLPSKEKKYFYQCDRSDSKDKKEKRPLSVVMKTCPSVISVVEGPGAFIVEYWDTHSGHVETPSTHCLQNELEVAISSVDMVNAINDSDDSLDKSENLLLSGNASPTISNAQKQSVTKTSSSSNANSLNTSSIKKMQFSVKFDGSKKKNTSILYSLASVACGKGISKKTTIKKEENKNTDPTAEINSNNGEKSVEESPSNQEKQSDIVPDISISEVISSKKESSDVPSISTVTTSLSTMTKTISSGLPAIAPKLPSVPTNTISSLITTNSAYPNQLVFVNPVGMNQNTLNSKQNVFTQGQNILLSLGPVGQNIISNNTTSQPINTVSVVENATSNANTNMTSSETSVKIIASDVTTTPPESALIVSQNASMSNAGTITSTASNAVPITLTTGLNNAPVILSSLPVGSTFMSVNNSLIPIATPSGTFLPTSLPPNIVLTPVIPGTTIPNMDSSLKTTLSSSTAASAPSPNIQTQFRYSTPSTIAITVSSIVKEPVYSSSAIKHMSNIAASSTVPVSSAPSFKTYSKSKNQEKLLPKTISSKISPIKNMSKYQTSTPLKSITNSQTITSETSQTFSASRSKLRDFISAKKGIATASNRPSISTVTTTSVSIPKNVPSARKRINRSILKPRSEESSLDNLTRIPVAASPDNTTVVNSQLNLAPISSTSIMPQHIQAHKPGTLLFESSGDVYMLEPVENDVMEPLENDAEDFSSKNMPPLESFKIKLEKSVQTSESSNIVTTIKPKGSRKRSANANDDAAVMLKVKCYQLEMQYLNILTECKQLKVELTMEKLKNAGLTGEKAPVNTAEEPCRSRASEIMRDIEDKFDEKLDANVYTMMRTSVLRSLYEDLQDVCMVNSELHKELENYRAHDKFYKSLKRKLYDEEF